MRLPDVPTSIEINWDSDSRDIGTDGNLTCTCPRSKPPATLRWFKGSDEITNEAIFYEQQQDNDGNLTHSIVCVATCACQHRHCF